MWKFPGTSLLIVAIVAEWSHATVIIDDFLVGPALSTLPPYSDSPDPSVAIVQEHLDPRHTWAGFRVIAAGTFPRERDNPPPYHVILTTSPVDNGRMAYFADIGTESLDFYYSASGAFDVNDPLLTAPLDFSAPNAALVIDVLYSSRMGDMLWFTGEDIHGRGFEKAVRFPESTEPFSLSLTLEPSDAYDWAAISQFRLGLTASNGSLSFDNIIFVPEPSNALLLMTGMLFLSRIRYISKLRTVEALGLKNRASH